MAIAKYLTHSIAIWESWFIRKIATNQLVVPLNALPPQLSTTEHGTTMLRPLCAHGQIINIFSSSSKSISSSNKSYEEIIYEW
jgi:hypothetical protein